MELRKFTCPEIVFGEGCRSLVGQYIKNFGVDKIMLVSDPQVSSQAWFKDIVDSLDRAEIDYVIETEVTVNPKDYECDKIGEQYRAQKCELILAVGGGSVIDCAKGVGVLASNTGSIRKYEGIDEICYPIPPLICIPTTSGSAAEISQFAIINNTQESYKMALVSKTLVPDLALMDPETTYTQSPTITIDSGLDVLAHAIEAVASNASSPLTDLHAKEAARLVIKWLAIAIKEASHPEARAGMLQASMNAGLAFSNASLGLVHAIAHALGGRYHLIHGELNGLLLESVVRFNYEQAKDKYQLIEKIFVEELGMSQTLSLAEMIHEFVKSIRPNRLLSDQGEIIEDIELTIKWVLRDPCIATNPREVSVKDVKMLYEEIRG